VKYFEILVNRFVVTYKCTFSVWLVLLRTVCISSLKKPVDYDLVSSSEDIDLYKTAGTAGLKISPLKISTKKRMIYPFIFIK